MVDTIAYPKTRPIVEALRLFALLLGDSSTYLHSVLASSAIESSLIVMNKEQIIELIKDQIIDQGFVNAFAGVEIQKHLGISHEEAEALINSTYETVKHLI